MAAPRVFIFVDETDLSARRRISGLVDSVLASYGHGLLVQAGEDTLHTLETEGYLIEALPDATRVKLRAVEFDTTEGAPETPAGLTLAQPAAAAAAPGYFIIQFVGPVKPEWRDQIVALGATLEDYVPENAFLARLAPGAQGQVATLPFVIWLGPYEPAYKVSPLLMGRRGRATGDEVASLAIDTASFPQGPEGNLTVLLHSASDRAKIVTAIESLGGSVIASEGDTITATLDLANAGALAGMVEVKWLEPYERPELCNDVAEQIMTVQDVWDAHALDGEGQIIAVCDTGIDRGVDNNTMHPDFRGKIVAIHDRVGDGANDVNSGHGTHVAGSALGSGTASSGAIQGTAPAARLVFQAIENNTTQSLTGIPADYNTLFQQAYNDGARIHSNSWAGHLHGQYTAASQDIDEFMWDHKDILILFAASNDGVDNNSDGVVDTDSMSPQATAKNCLTVGASENDRATGGYNPGGTCSTYGSCWPLDYPTNPLRDDPLSDDPTGMVAFSARGPTDDGRPKPDVV
ncbi:MAG: S8 family serine peptidase, partial [Chloroflexi bacterium]|nr:S8 family serine peptidase [Chloroflexota bacterium]